MVAQVLDSGIVTGGLSINYNVSADINRQVIVIVAAQDNGGQPNVTGVTADGQAATELVTIDEPVQNIHIGIWSTLEAAIVTGGAFQAIMSGTNLGGDTAIGVIVLKNCSQEAPEDTDSIADASTASATRTLTTQAESILIDALIKRNTADAVEGANQTEQFDFDFGGENTFSSSQSGSDGGVMSVSWAGADSNAYCAVSLIGEAVVFIPRTGGVI